MQRGFTFYDILGVCSTATREQIHRAYRTSVRTYHPDVNHAENAPQLMSALNEAWHTLRDPARRRAYDLEISVKRLPHSKAAPRVPLWQTLACEKCGKTDLHLRVAVFYYVWSLLVYSRVRAFNGRLCSRCRSAASFQSALFSVLLGPWGIPWGIPYTAKALLAAARGGEIPNQSNAQMLRHQAMAFLQRRDFISAKAALSQAQLYEPDPAVGELLNDPELSSVAAPVPPRWLAGQALSLATVPMVIAVVALAALTFLTPPRARHGTNTADAASRMQGASLLGRTCLKRAETTFGRSDQPSLLEFIIVRNTCTSAAKENAADAVVNGDPAQYARATYLSYGGIADIRLQHETRGFSELSHARTMFRTLAAGAATQRIRSEAADSLNSIVPWLTAHPKTLPEDVSASLHLAR